MNLKDHLAPHFILEEMCRTSHRTIDNMPPQPYLDNLIIVARDFLEPIRQRFGALYITSGFRCDALNNLIGGVRNSAHTFGCAADFVAYDKNTSVTDIVDWIVNESGLQYDQVIDEASSTSSWCHIGICRPGFETIPRLEALVMRNGKYSFFQ